MSRDGGATWRWPPAKDLVVNAVLALPGGTVLLGTDGAGVAAQRDAARAGIASNAGLLGALRVAPRVRPARRAGCWRASGATASTAASSPRPARAGRGRGSATGLEGREVLSLATAGHGRAGRHRRRRCSSGRRRAAPGSGCPRWWAGVDVHPRVNDVVALSEQAYLAATSHGLLRTAGRRRHLEAARARRWPARWPRWPCRRRDPGLVLAATRARLLHAASTAGERWALVGRRAGDADPHRLAVPARRTTAWSSPPPSRGLFRSTDAGPDLERAARAASPSPTSPAWPSTRTAARSTPATSRRGGVFRSADGGETWRRLPAEGLVTERVWTLAVDPTRRPSACSRPPPAAASTCSMPAASGRRAGGGSRSDRPGA